jgi:hypothetical protein
MADAKGEEGMDGVVYHDRDGDLEDDEDGDGRRRVSEPARKRQNTGNSTQGSYHQHSSTYPPIAVNRGQLGHNSLRPLYPPGPMRDHTNSSPKVAPSSLASIHYNANQPNLFGQGGMTESPKPISPSQADHHRHGVPEASMSGPRSPNMSQLHHQSFRGAGRGSSPMAMAPPLAGNGPHLPSLPGLGPIVSKQGSQGGKGSMLQHQQMPGNASQHGSMSSHGASSAGSMREIMGGNQTNIDFVSYMREMEDRMAHMSEEHEKKMQSLQNEVTMLRAQLAQHHTQG